MINDSETTPFFACFSQPPELPRKVLHINQWDWDRDIAGGGHIYFGESLLEFNIYSITSLYSGQWTVDSGRWRDNLIRIILSWGYKTHQLHVNHNVCGPFHQNCSLVGIQNTPTPRQSQRMWWGPFLVKKISSLFF